jgi:phage terminase Nu1 subunit (DNA packaging protein)
VLRTVRAGMLAVPSRVSQRLPHLSAHDVSEIDAEIRAALTEIGEGLPSA